MSRTDVTLAFVAALIIAWVLPTLGFLARGFLGRIIATLFPPFEPRSVRGGWNTEFWRGEDVSKEHADVHQFLHSVWGIINFSAKNKDYKFKGTLRGDVLVATYEVLNNPKAMDRGSFTIKLNNDGDTMTGTYSWTDDETSDVSSDVYKWSRVK